MGILTSALSPTNTLIGNPPALKKTLETGGQNLVRGSQNFLRDLRTNGGMPATARPGALEVGRDLAVTPGEVVQRDEYAELIQYRPTTGHVRRRPVLVVTPPIGRYYFLDLRPGRSFVEYSVSRELQTFLISWRNPGPEDKLLPVHADAVAPDGSYVRLLCATDRGSMAHFELGPGEVWRPVRHRTVEEIWFILCGLGTMWRQEQGADPREVDLRPGLSLTIPPGPAFQFRNTGRTPLEAVGVTMPPWPGADEAMEAQGPPWEANL